MTRGEGKTKSARAGVHHVVGVVNGEGETAIEIIVRSARRVRAIPPQLGAMS